VAYSQQYSLRTVNLISDLPGIDLYLNDRTPPTFGNVPFEYAEALVKLPTESLNIKITSAGAGPGAPFINQNVTVAAATAYTALAYGTSTAPKFKFLSRPYGQLPAAGKSLVRVVHAASIATTFDIYLDSLSGDPLFPAVAQDSATQFKSVDKKVVKLFITPSGSKLPLVALVAPLIPSQVDLLAHLTLIVTGTSQSNLKVYVLHGEDESRYQMTALEQAGLMLPSVRAVQALPTKTVPFMDIYLNSGLKTKKVVYRGATESYQGITEDSVTVHFVPVDEGPSNALLSPVIRLHNDTGYTTILTQHKDGGLTSMLVPTYLAEPNAGILKVRFANASDFFGNISIVLKVGNDTIHFDEVPFLTYTPWRQIPAGNLQLEAYRSGGTTPFYTGNYTASDSKLLTLIGLGDTSQSFSKFAVDVLDESVASSLPRMQSFSGPVESVEDEIIAASRALDLGNWPNPFTSDTRISFRLAQGAHVRIELFDPLGRRAGWTFDQSLEAGAHDFTLHADGLPAGVYTCVLQAGALRTTRQMMVVR
jgi:hypothetical protein